MESSEQFIDYPQRLWPSLLVAAILATVFPVMWLSHNDPIGLNLIFAPVYVPVAFGILWPIIVALQAVSTPFGGKWLPRHTVAAIMFLLAAPCCALILRMEIKSAMQQRAEESRQRRSSEQELKAKTAANSAANSAMDARGPLGFSEPLEPAEATALANYIYSHRDLLPDVLLRISEQYQDPLVMEYLARHKSCPPEALRILFTKAMQQKSPAPSSPSSQDVEGTLVAIAGHANTPPEILGKLLKVEGSSNVREIALKNPHVPKADKIAYLRRLCGAARGKEFHNQEEIRFAASDGDTPAETLECFAAQQGTRYFVASNPHTPIRVLQQLTQPGIDAETRKAAQENIDRRKNQQ